MSGSKIQWIACFLALVCLSAEALAQDVMAEAFFDPEILSVGQRGQYIVVINGYESRGDLNVRLPLPAGLNILSQSDSQEVVIRNGVVNITKTKSWGVVSNKIGKHAIRSYKIRMGNKNIVVPAAILTVVNQASSGNSSQGQNRSNQGNSRNPRPNSIQNGGAVIEIDLPREKLYVGESVFSKINVYVPLNTQVRSLPLPVKEGDAFSISEINPRAAQRNVSKQGKQYVELSYPLLITPLKSGKQPLNFSYPLVVYESVGRQNNRNLFSGIFNQTQARDVVLRTQPKIIDVRPLPSNGRPASFTGAIGEFSATRQLHAATAEVGEPVTMAMQIQGHGNFSRVEAPDLRMSDDWKTYPPKSQFEAKDDYGYQGLKNFEYILSPHKPGNLQVPAMDFSCFNPETGKYETQKLPALLLKVTESSLQMQVVRSTGGTSSDKSEFDDSGTFEARLIDIKTNAGKVFSGDSPLFYRWWFISLQAVIAVVCLVVYLIIWQRRRLLTDQVYARRIKLSQQTRQALRDAKLNSGDAVSFYSSSCYAICALVASRQKGQPEALTLSDVEDYLLKVKADADLINAVKTFFESSDALKYGAGSDHPYDGTSEYQRLEKVVAAMQNPKKNFDV